MNVKKYPIIINLIIFISIASIYMVPVSSEVLFLHGRSNYNIFSKVRMIFMAISIILIVTTNNKKKSTYLILTYSGLIFILKYLFYGEVDLGIVYVIGAISIVDFMLINKIDIKFCKKIFNIAFYLYVAQIIIFSLLKSIDIGKFVVNSSFGDANYTAYFSFCLGVFFKVNNQRIKSYIVWIIGLFTYSRLFILCVLMFIVLEILISKVKPKKIYKIMYKLEFYILFQIIILIICCIYIVIYNTVDPAYVYKEGFSRLTNMLDGSNYIRSLANVLAFKSINLKTILIGLRDNTFEGIHLFAHKRIFPHNLFWSLYIQYGFILTTIFISRYINIFKNRNYKCLSYYIVLLIYQSFLGTSSFYGIDLVLQMIIVSSICNKDDGGLNEQ